MRPRFIIAAVVLLVAGVIIFLNILGSPAVKKADFSGSVSTSVSTEKAQTLNVQQAIQTLEAEIEVAAKERNELREQLVERKGKVNANAAPPSIAPAPVSDVSRLLAAAASATTSEERSENSRKALEAMKKAEEERLNKLDPSVRDVEQAKQEALLHKMFTERFFDMGTALGLSDDEVNAVLDYMVDQQVAMDSADSPAYKARAEELSKIIGSEKFKAFQNYQTSGLGRRHVTELRDNFAKAGNPLAMDESRKLLSIFSNEIRKDFTVSHFNGNDVKSDAEFQKLVSRAEDFNRRIVGAAREVLNPDQILFLENSMREKLKNDQAFALSQYRKDGQWRAAITPANP